MKYSPVIFLLVVSLYCITGVPLHSREHSLKSQAKAAFRAEQYPRALELLHQARLHDSTDAEVYYLLGRYLHYLCYDSRPLAGYGREESDRILRYLLQAVALDSTLGDARYFIGAEYGARARTALLQNDIAGMKQELRRGYAEDGYPPWLLEYNQNILRSVGSGAILFVGGDAEATPLLYLQAVQGLRPDVTIIPGALLDRPWFVERLKQGIPGVCPAAPLSLTSDQIAKLRPYKWRTDTLEIPIPERVQTQWSLSHGTFQWVLEPDLTHQTRHRPMLGPGAAVFADIIQTNAWKRPVYFSLGMPRWMTSGLANYTQLSGLAQKCVPADPLPPELAVDVETTRAVLTNPANYANLPTIRQHRMPRISGLLANYVASTLQLGQYDRQQGMDAQIQPLQQLYDTIVTPEVIPEIRQFQE